MSKLLSVPTLVEVPFIIMKVGKYTFGKYSENYQGATKQVTFPDYMTSIQITKLNGELNRYEIGLTYPIEAGSDPNLIDHVFSELGDQWKIILSYGDWDAPSFVYREEEALITSFTSRIEFSGSLINYNITAQSTPITLRGVNHQFPFQHNRKPSEVIFQLLRDKTYGLSDIFYGMRDIDKIISSGIIDTDDQPVDIRGASSTDILSYLNYLVGSMVPYESGNSIAGNGFYKLVIIDDNLNIFGGPYFTVKKVSKGSPVNITETNANSGIADNAYEIDVGYPQDNLIISFNITNTNQWPLLCHTAESSTIRNYAYKIDYRGKLVKQYSPSLTRSQSYTGTTAQDRSWWSRMTNFPIGATLTFKGLVRPTILMSVIKLNVVFYGRPHTSSGYYTITQQVDNIGRSGYTTTLTLLRIHGDDRDIPDTFGISSYNSSYEYNTDADRWQSTMAYSQYITTSVKQNSGLQNQNPNLNTNNLNLNDIGDNTDTGVGNVAGQVKQFSSGGINRLNKKL